MQRKGINSNVIEPDFAFLFWPLSLNFVKHATLVIWVQLSTDARIKKKKKKKAVPNKLRGYWGCVHRNISISCKNPALNFCLTFPPQSSRSGWQVLKCESRKARSLSLYRSKLLRFRGKFSSQRLQRKKKKKKKRKWKTHKQRQLFLLICFVFLGKKQNKIKYV